MLYPICFLYVYCRVVVLSSHLSFQPPISSHTCKLFRISLFPTYHLFSVPIRINQIHWGKKQSSSPLFVGPESNKIPTRKREICFICGYGADLFTSILMIVRLLLLLIFCSPFTQFPKWMRMKNVPIQSWLKIIYFLSLCPFRVLSLSFAIPHRKYQIVVCTAFTNRFIIIVFIL